MFLTVAIFSSFAAGSYLGGFLAQRGVTAGNALQRYQRQGYLMVSIALGIGTSIGVLMIPGRHSSWFPAFLPLYAGAYFGHFIASVCCFCTGLLLFLEKPGWTDRQRLKPLVLFLAVSLSGLLFLIYQSLPITNLVEPPRILEGVVLQTTPYSCSAAAIATLARRVKPSRQTTELEVVKLARTSRQGTNTLAEIRVLEELGLAPQYERHLTISDLVARGQMGVLHVMEPVGKTKIQHAIALLEIDSTQGTLTVANPLYGKQVKAFDEMKDYWSGEAVLVATPPSSR